MIKNILLEQDIDVGVVDKTFYFKSPHDNTYEMIFLPCLLLSYFLI